MIDLIFNFANEVVLIKIDGKSVRFATTTFGAMMADISGLKLDYTGTIREFPDLKDDLEWREKAIKRFKEHIKGMKNEGEISDYIIYELRNKGYKPRSKQVKGMRPVRIG